MGTPGEFANNLDVAVAGFVRTKANPEDPPIGMFFDAPPFLILINNRHARSKRCSLCGQNTGIGFGDESQGFGEGLVAPVCPVYSAADLPVFG